jgi:hypothetical protein
MPSVITLLVVFAFVLQLCLNSEESINARFEVSHLLAKSEDAIDRFDPLPFASVDSSTSLTE